MKRKIIIIGTLLTLGAASLLTGCEHKVPQVEEASIGTKLIDQARDAVDQANQSIPSNPDDLVHSLTGD
ncbi:MAG: hypothetical protein IKQ49_05935 [Eubacterium sp.]|nr:hypothetical protein [Eubacterium sp.]